MDSLLQMHHQALSVFLQLGQLFGVQRLYHDEAAALALCHGRLGRLKDEQIRFLCAGGMGQIAW